MKKLILLVGLMIGSGLVLQAQEPVEVEEERVTEELIQDTIPVAVITDVIALDSIPYWTPEDVAMFATDTAPTPQYMTMVLLEEGVIEPTQVAAANRINKLYDQRIKALTRNPDVAEAPLQAAATAQDNAYKAILDDEHVRAYQQSRGRFQRQNWGYNWMMNNCWSPQGWTCGPEQRNWPNWMPMYEGRDGNSYGPGWMMR